jgi:hypothetical protein
VFTQLAEVRKMQFSGTKYDLADVTNMQSGNFREWLPTLADAGELSFEANYIPQDSTQMSLNNDFKNALLLACQIVLPNGLGTFAFNAYVTNFEIDLPIDKQASIIGKLKITGSITFWI